MTEKRPFFQTLPGKLIGLIALLVVAVGLLAILRDDSNPLPPPEESSFAENVLGQWINEDPNTGGVTRIAIRREGNETWVHAWGKCTPEDCDWGENKGTLEDDVLKITWIWSAGEKSMTLRMEGDRLQSDLVDTYTDDRPTRQSTYWFSREDS